MSTYEDESESQSGTRSRILDEAASLLSTAKAKLGDVADPIADKAREVADEQKEKHAKQIDSIARAVDSAAQELESEMPGVAGYIHDGAQSLGRVALQVRDRNLEELLGMVTDFSRRNPELAFGGFVLAGFTLARFLKSSSQPRVDQSKVEGPAYGSRAPYTQYQGA